MEQNRENCKKQIEVLKGQYEQNPDDGLVALTYAEKLFQLGDFSKSKEVLVPLITGKVSDSETLISEAIMPDAICLAAKIEYLMGNYAESERLFDSLIKYSNQKAQADNSSRFQEYKENAENGLALVYYQTNQYAKSLDMSTRSSDGLSASDPEGLAAMMRNFYDLSDNKPYQIEWAGPEPATIPFLATEPLPVIQAEIKGQHFNFLVDTGAGDTYINEDLANSLDIKSLGTLGESVFAGGKKAEVKYGLLDSMTLDGVKINNLPVVPHPSKIIKALSAIHRKNKIRLDGIIGTGIFKQFLTTMDYPGSRLILTQRESTATTERSICEIPFVMAFTHGMISKCLVNGKELNVFFDSGLAMDKTAILLMKETIGYTNTKIAKKVFGLGPGGAGITLIKVGYFDVDSFVLGAPLEAKNLSGATGIFPEDYYFDDEIGFFIDAVISHNFLKNYKWTIDFDAMKMTFT